MVIALAMAFVVITKPSSSATILIAVCAFFLGEAFWRIQIGAGKKMIFPAAFLRVYSMSLVAMFSYYLYSREARERAELKVLNERLKALDNMKSEFIANVSHELRTPLTSIKNACSVLKKLSDNKAAVSDVSVSDLLNIIDSNTDRQARLINDLLDLSRIEKGRAYSPRLLIDIGAVAQEAVASLDIQAKAKALKLELKIQPGLSKIYASGDQMLEVYTNLIDNAIKYTKSGGSILVEVANENDGIKSVISDTGIGIKDEEIDKLFDRFKRLESILQHKTKGTGLGLAIAKEIIDSHGGAISVQSSYGKGSKFIFTIPAGLRKHDKK